MNEYESLNHTKWECKYHVVFIPKYRRKALYGSLRKHLGNLFRELARHRECEIGEGHLMVDHVHMLLSIPPKYSVSQVMGYLKGRAPSTLPGPGEDNGGTLWGSISGHGAIGCQRSDTTKPPCGCISKNKRRQINASTSWDCSEAKAALSGFKTNLL